jgi:pectate lyase
MSALSSGRTTTCTSGGCSGGAGADYLYLANANEVTSVTTNASGAATAITMSSGATFYQYDFRDESAQFTETVTVDDTTRAVSVEQTFTMIWPCRNMTDRNLIMDMAGQACGMVAVHMEETGVYWIWGHTGTGSRKRVRVQTVEGDSGAALSDANAETITLACVASTKAVELADGDTVMAALI